MRLLRAARTVAHWESMSKLVRGMLTSMPTMFAVVVLTALVSYIQPPQPTAEKSDWKAEI